MLASVAVLAVTAVTSLEAAPQRAGPYAAPAYLYHRPGAERRQSPGAPGFPGPQGFPDPMLHFRQHNNFADFGVAEEADTGSGDEGGSGLMSVISAPRNYLNSMIDGVRSYFTGDEEEEPAPRRHRNAPRYPGPHGNFMNFRGPQVPPQHHIQYQNMLANPRFQELNSVFQPPFNQFRGPMGGLGAPFGRPAHMLGPQNAFLGRPGASHQAPRLPTVQQTPSNKHDGHWTGSFSSHYKQLVDQADERPIYHVANQDDQSERFSQHLVSSSQPQTGQPQPVAAASSSYAQQRSDSDLIPFESKDASGFPQGYVSRQDGSFVESY